MFDFAPGADFEAERADDEDVEPARQGGVPGKGSRIAAIFGLVQRRANDSGAARGVMSQAGGAAAGGATAAGRSEPSCSLRVLRWTSNASRSNWDNRVLIVHF